MKKKERKKLFKNFVRILAVATGGIAVAGIVKMINDKKDEEDDES